MANTFELISAVTVGAGGAASIDFTSIPATYTDLCLQLSLRGDTNSGSYQQLAYKFNGSTSGYNGKDLEGNGSTANSYSNTTITPAAGGTWGRLTSTGVNIPSSTSSTFTSINWYIPNYAGSNQKSHTFDLANENNSSTAFLEMSADLWTGTAAINQITMTLYSGNFAQYSTAYLYGISNS